MLRAALDVNLDSALDGTLDGNGSPLCKRGARGDLSVYRIVWPVPQIPLSSPFAKGEAKHPVRSVNYIKTDSVLKTESGGIS